MKTFLAVCLLMLMTTVVHGQKIQATWSANTDGLTDGYTIVCNDKPIADIEGVATTSWMGDVALVVGNNYFYMTAWRNILGGELVSEKSEVVTVLYDPTPPCTTRRCQCEGKKGWAWIMCYYWGIK